MNPYSEQPNKAFWKNFSLDAGLTDLYNKKFDIYPSDNIATAGSCFAQEISKGLKRHGYKVMDVEPAPASLSPSLGGKYGFGI